MDDRLNMVRGARSAGQLIELARAEGVELTTEQAEALYAKYHPPVGELTDRELEDVSGGGCGQSKPQPKFQVGDHVMNHRAATCGAIKELHNESYYKHDGCTSTYWVVQRISNDRGIAYTTVCPLCGLEGSSLEEFLVRV